MGFMEEHDMHLYFKQAKRQNWPSATPIFIGN
jgi:hypothetical protein